jgi:hypothetical protein
MIAASDDDAALLERMLADAGELLRRGFRHLPTRSFALVRAAALADGGRLSVELSPGPAPRNDPTATVWIIAPGGGRTALFHLEGEPRAEH